MAFKPIYGLNISLTAATAAGAGQLQVDPSAASALATALGANFTYAALSDGVNYEIIRIDSVVSPFLNVTRGFEGTTSSAFPIGTCIRYVWIADGITATAAGVTFTVTGDGAVTVTNTGTNSWNVHVPQTALTTATPTIIEILGAYPNFEIDGLVTFGGCCGGGGGGGGTGITLTGSGIANVTGASPGTTFGISVLPPNFIAGPNMTISGTWPNITFSSSGGGGGGGVASVTGSAKISISGTPTNPVINLGTTGAGGTYNGVTYDAWGTITGVNSAYIPITTVTSGNPLATITYPASGTVDITYAQASTTNLGLAKMAAPNAIDSNNPADSTSSVSPAGINAVISSLTGVSFISSYGYTADLAATYTNVLSAAVTFSSGVAAGHVVLLTAHCEILDTALAAGTSPTFGIAVFNGATLVQGIKSMTASSHYIQFTIPGPIPAATTYTLKSTALAGTASVVAVSMTAVVS